MRINKGEWWLWAMRLELVMMFPKSEDEGKRLSIEDDVLKSCNPREHDGLKKICFERSQSAVTEAGLRDGGLSGLILQIAQRHEQKRGQLPSKRQVFRHVSKTVPKTPHADTIKQVFRLHRDRAHYWAARHSLIAGDIPAFIPFAHQLEHSDFSYEGWKIFLAFANAWRNFGLQSKFQTKEASRIAIEGMPPVFLPEY